MSRIGDVFFAIPLLLGAIIFLVSLPDFFNDNYFLIVLEGRARPGRSSAGRAWRG